MSECIALLKGQPYLVAQCGICDMMGYILPRLSVLKGASLPHWEWQLSDQTLPSNRSHQKINCHSWHACSALLSEITATPLTRLIGGFYVEKY